MGEREDSPREPLGEYFARLAKEEGSKVKCYWGGREYDPGDRECIDGTYHFCTNSGSWSDSGQPCP